MPLKPKIETEIFHNVKEQIYAEAGIRKLTVSNRRIFKDSGWEECADKSDREVEPKPQTPGNEVRNDSVVRAKRKIFDIAMLNEFRYFATWTLDGELIDRESPQEVSRKLKNFLYNKANRIDLSYLVVPEFHKDGKGIHMHALISGNLKLLDSGKLYSDGRVIWNMSDWTYGWSTCLEVTGDRSNVAKYITKYISKDFRKIFGNFYYAGGNIQRNPPLRLYDAEYALIDSPEYDIPGLGLSFKYITVEGAET